MRNIFTECPNEDQIKQDEMGEAFSMRRRNENRIQSFDRKPTRKKLLWMESVDRRMKIRMDFRGMEWEAVDWIKLS
jgi:hypothetical protein